MLTALRDRDPHIVLLFSPTRLTKIKSLITVDKWLNLLFIKCFYEQIMKRPII